MALPGRSNRSGGAALAEMLDGYGVTHLFMVPAIIRRTFKELELLGSSLQIVATHGEKAAAYMADGYARVSGRPGVCAAQIVGALNLAAGLRDAYLAHAPLIAITGGRDPVTKFRHVYQEVDDLPAFDPVTKLNATVDDVTRIPDMLRQAFRVATTGTPGPVHLQFRGNEGQLDQAEGELDAIVEPQYAIVPPHRPIPVDDDLLRALRRIRAAERPVIVAGGGVHASGAAAELVAFAEAVQIPVATSLNGKDCIVGNHPLSIGVVGSYSREAANRLVTRADLVVFVGSQAGGMTTHFWTVPAIGTSTIQIDLEPAILGRNYPLDVGILADAKLALARLRQLLGPSDVVPLARRAWLAEVAQQRERWLGEYGAALCSDAVPIRPERLCAELSAWLPDDAVVVVDTGHAGMWMGQFFDLTSPNQTYLRSCGHLGWAFPAGIGAKCAAPDRPVVTFTGDGGLYYHLAEIETAVRRGINVITVVNNNFGGNQSQRGFDRSYGGKATEKAKQMFTYERVDLAAVAESMGALGIVVERAADLPGALDQAVAAGRPAVLDVRTDFLALAPPAVT